jgi:hypothetical protein
MTEHVRSIEKSTTLTADGLLDALEEDSTFGTSMLSSLPATLTAILGVGGHAKVVFASFRPDMLLGGKLLASARCRTGTTPRRIWKIYNSGTSNSWKP